MIARWEKLTLSTSGKRLFKLWLCQPLSEASAINARLDAVDDLNANPSLIESFLKATKGVPDLERVLSRIHAGNCKPSAFSKVLDGLSTISHCFAKFSKQTSTFNSTALKALVEAVPDLSEHISDVQAIYTEDEGMLVPNEGADEQFDNTNRAIEEAEDALQSQLKKYKKELKCPEMKFKDIGSKHDSTTLFSSRALSFLLYSQGHLSGRGSSLDRSSGWCGRTLPST